LKRVIYGNQIRENPIYPRHPCSKRQVSFIDSQS
jgi:hypothetical protein